MITKYNVGDTVLVPMTVKSISLDDDGICYKLLPVDAIRDGKYDVLEESVIHSRLEEGEVSE